MVVGGGSSSSSTGTRPIPDPRDFKRTILSLDFYKDIRDEAELQKDAFEVAMKELGDQPLQLEEVQELLLSFDTNLTPAQKKRKEKEQADYMKRVEKLPPDEKAKVLEDREKRARKVKAKNRALQRLKSEAETKQLTSVPLHFVDETEYMEVFLPLFFTEARAQIQRCKESEMATELEEVVHHAFRLEGNFVKLEFRRQHEQASIVRYGTGDLLLLTQGEKIGTPHPVHLLALVDHSVNVMLHCTVFIDMDAVGESRSKRAGELISKQAGWRVAKITSMATLTREYEGLKSLPGIHLKDAILNVDDTAARGDASTEMQAASALEVGAEKLQAANKAGDDLLQLPKAIETWMGSRYNESQQNAIRSSSKVSGITLVQGPPGTGKTTTVLGILAVLMNATATESKGVSYTRGGKRTDTLSTEEGDESESEDEAALEARRQDRVKRMQAQTPWLQPNFVPWVDAEALEVPVPGSAASRQPYKQIPKDCVVSMSEVKESVAPQKVLVCAPSNAAIDEVMRRIAKEGIVDAQGQKHEPAMLRLGPNVHKDNEEYSLEKLVKERLKSSSDMPDLNQQETEKLRLMTSARIVCTTLSISGHRDMVGFPEDFDTVVIDEASQGVEISTLVPLKLGCRRLILVGDPVQLPATCFSEMAKEYSYDRSLFQRLQMSQYKVNMLNTQYRMHPAISSFPSAHFYDGNLLDFRGKAKFEEDFPTAWSKLPCFAPVAFFNIKGAMKVEAQSFVNDEEADFIVRFFKVLGEVYPDQDWRAKIGVISPYAQQVNWIRARFRKLYGLHQSKPCPVDVGTVDGFQGREKDCILLSLVRGSLDHSNSIGFLRDRRRMNVAFTRARLNLWVVGNADALKYNEDWKEFMEAQVEACRMLRVTPPFKDFLPRYLKNWYERHPEEQKPTLPSIEDGTSTDANVSEAPSFTISEEKLEEIRQEEEARLRSRERDIEEVSDGLGGDEDLEERLFAEPDRKRKADENLDAELPAHSGGNDEMDVDSEDLD